MKRIPEKILWAGLGLILLAFSGCGEKEKEKVSPPSVPDHVGKARVFYHQGDYTKAVEMYQKALVLDPGYADAYLQLGIIYDDNLKDEKRAVYCYRKYLALEPKAEKAAMVRNWLEDSGRVLRGEEPPEEESPVKRAAPERKVSSGKSGVSGGAKGQFASPVPAKSPLPPPDRVKASTPNSYTVKEGDTLARIAEVFYGDRKAWRRIFEANGDVLSSPHALKPGQVLKIPPDGNKAVVEM